MDRTERFYKIDQLLNDMTVVPLATFLDDLALKFQISEFSGGLSACYIIAPT
jgi:hypothetical protein